jgi:hypothetical protein
MENEMRPMLPSILMMKNADALGSISRRNATVPSSVNQ